MHPEYNTHFGLVQTVDGICRLSLLCVYISWTEELDMDKFLLLANKDKYGLIYWDGSGSIFNYLNKGRYVSCLSVFVIIRIILFRILNIYIYIPYVNTNVFQHDGVLCSKHVAVKFKHSVVNWWLKLCCVYWFGCKCPRHFNAFFTIVAVGKKSWGTICTLWGAKPVHSYKQSTCGRAI